MGMVEGKLMKANKGLCDRRKPLLRELLRRASSPGRNIVVSEGKEISCLTRWPPRLVARNICCIEPAGRAPHNFVHGGRSADVFRALVVATPEWLSAVATPLTGPHLVIESVSEAGVGGAHQHLSLIHI